jgi:hypothetical protein
MLELTESETVRRKIQPEMAFSEKTSNFFKTAKVSLEHNRKPEQEKTGKRVKS